MNTKDAKVVNQFCFTAGLLGTLGLITLLLGCNRIQTTLDPVSQGVSPRVVEVVQTANKTSTQAARDAALLGFYFNNKVALTRKDVEYIAHATSSQSANDTILVDWSNTQRVGIPYVPPEASK